MPSCSSPNCSCKRTRRKSSANRLTAEFLKGQALTLKRLRRVLGLKVTMESGHFWLTMGGYKAPAVVMHGFVSMKINHDFFKRIVIPISRYTKPDNLAYAIRQNHISYVHSCVVKVHEE